VQVCTLYQRIIGTVTLPASVRFMAISGGGDEGTLPKKKQKKLTINHTDLS
jgi:hypothetical protein